MGLKAVDHVNACICSMENLVNELEKAECCCEKESNKKLICNAKESLKCACNHLHHYCD